MGKRARKRDREYRQSERELAVLRANGWRPILTEAQHRQQDALVREIEAAGYEFEYVEWCEDARTPGILGYMAGVTTHNPPKVKVRTRNMTGAQVVAITAHELEHVQGAEWGTDHPHLELRCGGRINAFGPTR